MVKIVTVGNDNTHIIIVVWFSVKQLHGFVVSCEKYLLIYPIIYNLGLRKEIRVFSKTSHLTFAQKCPIKYLNSVP